ncbi:MAG: mevalonate kinase [Anaerolineae bacterium]|nr:mevalonate kinase [Anaerolineae bacterium]
MTASAAGKAILLGEHAVVYGRPAIAVPLSDVRATAEVEPLRRGQGTWIEARDLQQRYQLGQFYDADVARPLQLTVENALGYLQVPETQRDLRLVIHSHIPIASGMGSGTAVAAAIVRALAQYCGQALSAEQVSRLVYQTEIELHGTPSGIDNSVVAYERPIYFVKDVTMLPLKVGAPLHVVVAHTGVASRTRDAVAQVRRCWETDKRAYDLLFDRIGAVVDDAKEAIGAGRLEHLGRLMDLNGQLLSDLGVSSVELERLIGAAHNAGSLGAKLSGGGLGGCMIALVSSEGRAPVAQALRSAGAERIVHTTVRPG